MSGRSFRNGTVHRPGIGGRKDMHMAAIALVQAEEGIFAQCPVGALLVEDIIGPADFMHLPVFIRDRVKCQIGIHQFFGNFLRRIQGLAEPGQDFLFPGRKRMRFPADQAFHGKAVRLHDFRIADLFQLFLGQFENLRLGKSCPAAHIRRAAENAGIHAVCLSGSGIFTLPQTGIVEQIVQFPLQGCFRRKISSDRFGIVQGSLPAGHILNQIIQRIEFLLPFFIILIKGRKIPVISGIGILAFFQFGIHRLSPFYISSCS